MKKLLLSKKGLTMSFLIPMIVSLLGFLVFLSFLVSSSNTVVNEVDEVKCKSYLEIKNSNLGKIGDFLLQLSNNCKTGVMEVDESDRDQVFRTLADRSYSCWKRYGEGEIDFMSNFDTTGKYCFPCTQISFEGDEFDYTYNEFIKWTQENGPDGVEGTYGELVNFEYFDPTTQEFSEVDRALEELENELETFQEETGEVLLIDLYLYFSDYRTELLDLRDKKISSDQEQFVVLKYERINNSLSQVIQNTVISAGVGGSIGALAAGQVTKIVLSGPIGIVSTIGRSFSLIQKSQKMNTIIGKSLDAMTTMKSMKKSTKLLAVGGAVGGVAGGSTGLEYNENYNQYVDVLNEEQYFRVCGVKPYNDE